MKKQILFLIACVLFQGTLSQFFDVETIKNEDLIAIESI
jgi:hypothetical protein